MYPFKQGETRAHMGHVCQSPGLALLPVRNNVSTVGIARRRTVRARAEHVS